MSKLGIFDVAVRYGKVPALSDVSFAVEEGERLFISGPNGAGKSSLLKAICGAVPTTHGRIEVDGDVLNGRAPEAIARLGLTMVPEGREIFGTLTVEENLRVGTGIRRDTAAIETDIAGVYDSFPILGERRHANAGALSGGQQLTLIIVEQSSARAARVGGRMVLLRGGNVVGDGDAAAFAESDLLKEAYFGQDQSGEPS